MLEAIAAGPPPGWDHADAWARRMRRWARACRPAHRADRLRRRAGDGAARCRPGGVQRGAQRLRSAALPAVRGRPRGVLATASGCRRAGRCGGAARGGALHRREAPRSAHPRVRACPAPRRAGPPRWCSSAAIRGSGRASTRSTRSPPPGRTDVFLAGWHAHDELPAFFCAADVQVLASVREQFGLVLVEGMACGLPAIAVDRFGPAEIVEDGGTGWLVEPDDEEALAHAMHDAIERARSARRAASRRGGPRSSAGPGRRSPPGSRPCSRKSLRPDPQRLVDRLRREHLLDDRDRGADDTGQAERRSSGRDVPHGRGWIAGREGFPELVPPEVPRQIIVPGRGRDQGQRGRVREVRVD